MPIIVSLPFPLATLLTTIAALAYGLLSWQVIRQVAHQSGARLAQSLGKPHDTQPSAGVSPALLGFAIAVHAAALYLDMFGGGTVHFSFALTVSVILWLAVVLHGFESLAYQQRGLLALILPTACAGVLLPLIFPVEHPLVHIDAWLFRLHFILAMLAYGVFLLATLQACLLWIAERELHDPARLTAVRRFPPLLRMENLLFRMLGIAFLLLTASLASGLLVSEQLNGTWVRADHKTIFACLSWLIFGALLLGRKLRGWRGKKATAWTITGFVMLMLAYVGSRFVLEVILNRPL
ncbi:MAG: Inner membrane protein YpjD [Fluviibacter phosphoraccumulans EoVTN8]